MAQRKTPPSSSGKAAAKATAKLAGNRGSASRGTATKTPTATSRPVGRPPAKKKPGKSIVNQRQTPWGLIITTIVIVLFAASIVGYVVINHKSTPKANGGCTKLI